MKKWLLVIAGVLTILIIGYVVGIITVTTLLPQQPELRPPVETKVEIKPKEPMPQQIDMQAIVEAKFRQDAPNDKVLCRSTKDAGLELVWCNILTADGKTIMVMGQYDVRTTPYSSQRHIGISYTNSA